MFTSRLVCNEVYYLILIYFIAEKDITGCSAYFFFYVYEIFLWFAEASL